MLPRLYEPSENPESFKTNGLGFITDVAKCEVTEVINDTYTLALEVYPTDKLASKITVGMIIKAKANALDPPQLFEITRMVVGNDMKLNCTCQHIKSRAMKNCTLGGYGHSMNGNPEEIMAEIYDDLAFENAFTFHSDITRVMEFSLGLTSVVKLGEIYGGNEGSLLSLFGGEYHFDNFDIYLLKERGRTTKKQIRYGVNISDYKQTITNENVYTHIMSFADTPTVSGSKQDHVSIVFGPYEVTTNRKLKNVLILDFTQDVKDSGIQVDPSTGLNYIYVERMLRYNLMAYNANHGTPSEKVSINVTYDSELDNLQDIMLCDTVDVLFGKYKTRAKITKTVYDSIAERYTSVLIGDIQTSLYDLINKRG